MNVTQFEIAQAFLDNYNNDLNRGYGLYNGKMGLCLCYMLLSQFHDSRKNHEIGISLYEEVNFNIEKVDSIGVSDGLLGIGFGINFLHLNKLVKIDIDEALYCYDDLFYQLVTLRKSSILTFENGILGISQYFYQRMFSQNRKVLEYRYLLHRECLTLLTTEFRSFLVGTNGILKIPPILLNDAQILEISQSFILLFKIWKLRYNIDLLSEYLQLFRGFIEQNFVDIGSCGKQLSLLYSYSFVGYETNCIGMIQKTNEWILQIEEGKIDSTFDKLLYFKICRRLGCSSKEIIIHPNSLFESLIVLDEMRKKDGVCAMEWLNMWGL